MRAKYLEIISFTKSFEFFNYRDLRSSGVGENLYSQYVIDYRHGNKPPKLDFGQAVSRDILAETFENNI